MQSPADPAKSRVWLEKPQRILWVISCLAVVSVLLALWEGPRRDGYPVAPSVRLTVAVKQLESFEAALDNFKFDIGSYPAGTNGLMALLQQPPTAVNWHGPYIDTVPKDPWGRDYRYECPGKHVAAGYPYDLWSEGGPPVNSVIANYGEFLGF
jgi:general secretion pathway protein G